MIPTQPAAPRLFKALLSLLLVALMGFAVRQGVADFLRLGPGTRIDQFKAGQGEGLSTAELVEARAQLLQAQGIDPGNPVVPEYLAQIAMIRAHRAQDVPVVALLFLDEALGDYRRALALRPASGYLWAGEMVVLEARGRIEPLTGPQAAERDHALVEAARWAPWERPVLQEILGMGVATPVLGQAAQGAYRGAIARAARLGLAKG